MILTAEHFSDFQDAVWKWGKFFGLSDWEFSFGFDEQELQPKSAAEVNIDLPGKMARFTLFHIQSVDRPMERLAFHEVCEVLLGRLTVLAGYRYVTESEIIEASHDVIRRWEHLMFDAHKLIVMDI